MSVMIDISALAVCTETTNCSSENNQFPEITTGQANYNTAHGYHSDGMNITSGDYNTTVGSESGRTITTGSYNTAVGSNSMLTLNNGNNNTAIGYNSGSGNATGSGNIFIGYEAGPSSGSVSNKLYIANSSGDTPLIHGDFSNKTITINDNLVINGTFSDGNYTFDTNGNVSGLGTINSGTITSSGNIIANGSIQTNTIQDSNGERYIHKDTTNDIVHIGSNSMLFYDSSTYGKDIMASSTGNIQIGRNPSDTTTIIGDLIIQEPTEANHAATRKYADQVSLMATTLDTRLPLYGNKHSLNLSSASTNNEIAFGLNFVGIYDGLHLPLDFSLGSAMSGDYNMGKLSIGLSW